MGLVVVVVAFGADVFVVDVEGIIVVLAVVGFVLILDVAEVTIELVVGCSETFVALPRADIVVQLNLSLRMKIILMMRL